MESLMNVIGGGGTRSGRRGRSGLTPVTTGCIRLVGLCCMLLLPVAVGLYQDEAGKLDFTIRTAGHGPVRWAYVWPQPSTISTATSTDASKSSILLTTDARETSSSSSSTTPSSCYLAGRNITTGAVLWRRNVCVESSSLSKMKPVTSFVVSAMDNTVVTVNNRGILQAWDALSGALLWDTLLDPQEQQQQQLQSYTSLTLAMLDSTGSGSSPTLRSNGIVENGDSVTVVLVESSSVTFPDRRIMGWNAQTGEVLRPDQMVGSAIDMKQALQTMKDRSDSSLIQSSCLDTIFTGQDHTVAASQGGNAHWEGTVDDPVIFLQTISCDESTGTTLLVSTSRGSTTVLKWSHGNQFQTLWHAEEGLASVTTAYLVDNSHYQVGDDSDSHKDKLLSFSYRIQAQWKALASLGKETAASRRDHLFGFVKVAVLLSPSTHRIFGLTTVGTNTRGQVIWKLNLPPNTHTHRLVHGAPNAAHSVHGINGITHSKDFLVISWSDEQIFWNCFDGTNGLVHDAGMKRIKQPVKQIIPILAHGKCRQGALLLFHDNESVVLLPPTEPAPDHVSAAMRTGWYTHVIDQETNTLTTLKIHDTMRTTVTGMAAFPGEQIVTVSYPSRDEVIQSPSQVLGDDSVLLKYINPHLAVIVTMINDPVPDEWASVLLRQKNFTPRSKTTKPMGVTPTSDPIETEMVVPPNLFINVVDTITGRILYRASHSNAAGFPIPQVLISENWVIYTYQNIKTRRMELGVLALVRNRRVKNRLSRFKYYANHSRNDISTHRLAPSFTYVPALCAP